MVQGFFVGTQLPVDELGERLVERDHPVGVTAGGDRVAQLARALGIFDELADARGLDHDLETARTQLASVERRGDLIEEIRSEHPDVNGNGEKALEGLKLNAEELQKKETFLEKVYKFPVRHPFITGIAALYAAYQFGFKLPGAIERAMSAVPLDKMKNIIQSIGPVGGAVTEGPAGMMPSAPGIGVG